MEGSKQSAVNIEIATSHDYLALFELLAWAHEKWSLSFILGTEVNVETLNVKDKLLSFM